MNLRMRRRAAIAAMTLTATACASAQAVSEGADYKKYLQMADSARVHIAEERWGDAARCTREALRIDPANVGNVMLFSNLGLAAGMEGKIGEAMQSFDIALSRAPKNLAILTSKAKVLVHASDTEGALQTLDEILREDSVAEWPLQTRGLLRMRGHDFKGAYSDFSLLAKSWPRNTWGPAGMAKCMELQGYPSEAAGYYRDAISRAGEEDPDLVEFQLGLIENLGHTGKTEEGLEITKEALKMRPNDGRLYLLRGWLKRQLLIYREAEADKKLAIAYGVDPQTVERFFPAQ